MTKQEIVYSKEWFVQLDRVDPEMSQRIRDRIAARKSPSFCTICSAYATRDYAVLGARCLSPVRLCRICHDLYTGTFGGNKVIPFAGRATAADRAKTPRCKRRGNKPARVLIWINGIRQY
ncbi:MAG: hypothetical protein ACAH80_02355 [Alphaproteobacteria bacterium]